MASSSCPPSLLLRSHFPPAEAAAPDLQTPPAAAAAAAVGLKVKVTRMASTTAIKVALKPSKSQQDGILEHLKTKISLAGGITFLFSINFLVLCLVFVGCCCCCYLSILFQRPLLELH